MTGAARAARIEIAGWGVVCGAGDDADAAAARLLSLEELAPAAPRSPILLNRELPCYEVLMEADPRERAQRLLQRAFDAALIHSGLRKEDVADAFVLGGTTAGLVSDEHARILQATSVAVARSTTERGVSAPAEVFALEGNERGPGAAITAFCEANGLCGEHVTLTTACTSSAMALVLARRILEAGTASTVIVAGVEPLVQITLTGFRNLLLYDRERCRPFSLERSGMQIGEGAAVLVLRREGDTRDAAGADVLARRTMRYLLDGGALHSRNAHLTSADTTGEGAAAVMRAALEDAGVDPREVCAVKAHGTGTADNDLAEGRGIGLVFTERPPVVGLKSAVGHTLGAAGALETALFLACLERGLLPRTRGFTQVDPEIGFAPTAAPVAAGPGCYLFNFLGFGGSYCSYVVRAEERGMGAGRSASASASASENASANAGTGTRRRPVAVFDVIAATGLGSDLRVPVDEPVVDPVAPLAADAFDGPLTQAQRIALRRSGRFIKACVAGSALLLERVPREGIAGRNVGLFLGSGLCNQDEARMVADQVLATRGETVSPIRFSNSVANIALFVVAQTHGIDGVQISISQEGRSFTEALRLATLALEFGSVELALVGGVDIAAKPYRHIASRMGLSHRDVNRLTGRGYAFGEGSHWLLLARKDVTPSVVGARPVGELSLETPHPEEREQPGAPVLGLTDAWEPPSARVVHPTVDAAWLCEFFDAPRDEAPRQWCAETPTRFWSGGEWETATRGSHDGRPVRFVFRRH